MCHSDVTSTQVDSFHGLVNPFWTGLEWQKLCPAGAKISFSFVTANLSQLGEMGNNVGRVKISTSGLTAHACCPYSGITLVRVNGETAESGLDFTYARL